MTDKNRLPLFALLFSIVLLLIAVACSGDDRSAPLARHGVLDLSRLDMARLDPVRLDGEWEFYWQQLLSPKDFPDARTPAPSGYLSLPGSWDRFPLKGKKIGAAGYATLRLRILPGPGTRDLALEIGLVNSAYRLWAGNELIMENGVIGRDRAGEKPIQTFERARLHIENRPMDLVLQISNYHDREGGLISSLTLGSPGKLEAQRLKRRALSWITIGSLLVMGIYHVFLYAFRRKDTAPLYFGIYCLLWMAFALTNNANGWLLRTFSGDIPQWFVNRIDLICVVISAPVIYSFLRTLYPHEFSLRLQRVTWIAAAVFLVPGLFASTMTFTSVISVYWVICILLIAYMLTVLVRAIGRGREGAAYILLGFSVLGIAAVNDMLYDLQMIRSVYVMEAGMLGFILFQACALSLRFSRAFASVELLSRELRDKNTFLRQEILERARLEREVVNISEEERRRISRNLHDGLCQKLTGARLNFSVLMRHLTGNDRRSPQVVSVSSLLEESVNQAYDLSRGLWPVEHEARGASSLEELTRRLAESSGIAIDFSRNHACKQCANTDVIQLYRIAQEAITNAVKHARPGKITVSLDCMPGGQIALTVCDNGIGRSAAAPSAGGLGMSIMSHRARIIGGELNVADADGGGTIVTCIVPCTAA